MKQLRTLLKDQELRNSQKELTHPEILKYTSRLLNPGKK
jgi:hypothetical protein